MAAPVAYGAGRGILSMNARRVSQVSPSHGLIQLANVVQGGWCAGDGAAVLRGDVAEEAGVAEHVARHGQGGRVHTLLPEDTQRKAVGAGG